MIQRVKQPENQLARRLPASQSDRFGIRSIHECKLPFVEKESCSRRRDHVNAYKIELLPNVTIGDSDGP